MTDTSIAPLTPEEEQNYREALAAQERWKAEQAAMARTEFYNKVKPIVESDSFTELQAAITQVMAENPAEDGFFRIHASALATIMANLAAQVSNFVPYSPPVEPVVVLTDPQN